MSRETYVLHKSDGPGRRGNFLLMFSSSLKFELVLKAEARRKITEQGKLLEK